MLSLPYVLQRSMWVVVRFALGECKVYPYHTLSTRSHTNKIKAEITILPTVTGI